MMKIWNHIIKNEIMIASLLFLLPLINFINPTNIKQIDSSSLYFLFFFNLFICFVFLLTIFLIKKLFLKKEINNLYLIICLFYLSLFLHNDIKIFVDDINLFFFDSWRISKINSLFFNEIYIFFTLILISMIFYYQKKFFTFHKILKTFIIFFISTNLILYSVNFYSFEENASENYLELNNLDLLKLNKSENKIKQLRPKWWVKSSSIII